MKTSILHLWPGLGHLLVVSGGIVGLFLAGMRTSKPPERSNTSANQDSVIHRLDGSDIRIDVLTGRLNKLALDSSVYGMAIAVIQDGQTIYQHYFGKKNVEKNLDFAPNTIFYAASFSKIIFATTAMKLVEQGIIDLDKPLVEYLAKPLYTYVGNDFPGYRDKPKEYDYHDLEGDDRVNLITPRMCLSHTTGFPNWRWFEDDQKLKIKFDPGTRYSYSGEGLYLLQFVIEQVTGRDLEDLAQEYVFKPFGMHHSSYVWQDTITGKYTLGHNSQGEVIGIHQRRQSNGAGSMNTTMEDMTRFYQGILAGQHLLPSSYQELFSPQIRILQRRQFGPQSWVDGPDNDAIRLSYGLGFGIYYTPYGKAVFKEGHDDGWQHYSVAFPEQKMALIIMTNNDNGEKIFNRIIKTALGNDYTPWYWEMYEE